MLALIIRMADRALHWSILIPARQEVVMIAEALELREIERTGVREAGGLVGVAAIAVRSIDHKCWFGGERREEVEGAVVVCAPVV